MLFSTSIISRNVSGFNLKIKHARSKAVSLMFLVKFSKNMWFLFKLSVSWKIQSKSQPQRSVPTGQSIKVTGQLTAGGGGGGGPSPEEGEGFSGSAGLIELGRMK